MADEKKIAKAEEVYNTLCEALDDNSWKYTKDDEKLIVKFGVKGEDVPMDFIFAVDIERQLIRLLSPMPFKMSESKRMEGAIAACVASYGMVDGSFDYDISDGSIYFRMTASFRESIIGKELFHYMIGCSCATIDQYNDRFFALNKDMMSISEFISKK